jgi:hypothetical protein
MKKTLTIVVIILALIVALPLINFLRWTFQAKKPLDIILVDKTSSTLERNYHRSFSWVLNAGRFVNKEHKTGYSYTKDYYGFSPKRPLREKLWSRNDYRLADLIILADKNDAVYFADTYGVFRNDWYKSFTKSRRSTKMYGGLNNNDRILIKEMKDRNKLIIMEYNSFDYPTAQFESVSTQEKLGVTFTGWTGKYFATLDTTAVDFPVWMTPLYRKQYGQPWKFTKPGVVFIKEKNIAVLELGNQVTNALPSVITDSAGVAKYGVIPEVSFENWFDVIDPLQNNVISYFKIETTPIGDTLLQENNLTNMFPAVVQDNVTGRTFYFSGDFATSNVSMSISHLKGVDMLKGILYSDKPEDPRRFFWLYYRPLVTGIFTDYYNSINKK